MRYALALTALTLSGSALAHASDEYLRGYYGPMNSLGAGYHDQIAKDGFWKIEAGTDGPGGLLAIDVAIYRAAEMAKAAGHSYVEIHDAVERRSRLGGAESVTLFARPADAPIHPATCRSGRPKRCYTADVALVFARLSGADGRHPGFAAPSYVDKYGQTVMQSGFGTGAVSAPPQ